MDLTPLQTHGYVVVKNFLDETDIANLFVDYQKTLTEKLSDRFASGYKVFAGVGQDIIKEKVTALLAQIRDQTDITTNTVDRSGLWFDNRFVTFPWHQDHDPYYFLQNSYHTMNFWCPVIKPKIDECNVKVIPCSSHQDPRLLYRGATRYRIANGITKVFDDQSGKIFELPYDINDLAHIPHVGVGDALIMRNDVIHATDLSDHYRLSYSISCHDNQGWLNKQHFYIRTEMKERHLSIYSATTDLMVKAFELVDNVQICDLEKYQFD